MTLVVIKMLEEVRRMKQAVENAGLSYMELEKRTGVSHSTLQRYLTGKTNRIPLSAVEKIATATNVSAAWIMGWEESPTTTPFPAPTVTDDVVTFPVIGDVAAGYDQIAIEDWSGDTVQIPAAYLHGRPRSDYFVLNVHGDSMYPMYIEGDKVLVLKADTLERSGQVGVLLYNGDNATVKKIEYAAGEDWLRMVPINPNYPPKTITGTDLEQCRVIGIPKMLVREIQA
nr:MAG TPA: Repressor protein CI [Caudoviricetes sp.]